MTDAAVVGGAGALLLLALPAMVLGQIDQQLQLARAQAERAIATCADRASRDLAPADAERRLREAMAPPESVQPTRRTATPAPDLWRATVIRVVLRRCGDAHLGMEVASRWTARRPGDEAPAYDAIHSRGVAGARPDPRLVHSTLPPWEVPVASAAPCRPIAAYCDADGTTLLMQDLADGVRGARDAIAAGR